MTARLYSFSEFTPVHWIAEDMEKLTIEFGDNSSSAPVAYQQHKYYGVMWSEGNTPTIDEVRSMLKDEGVEEDNVYDLTESPFVL
jgi:hypothetical protein